MRGKGSLYPSGKTPKPTKQSLALMIWIFLVGPHVVQLVSIGQQRNKRERPQREHFLTQHAAQRISEGQMGPLCQVRVTPEVEKWTSAAQELVRLSCSLHKLPDSCPSASCWM